MADELTIKVKAKLDEGSVSEMQTQLDNIGKNKKDGIKLQLDKSINTQISNLRKNLEKLSNKVYPIKIQIDQNAISNIQNLTDSLNKAIANVQNNVTRQLSGGAGSANYNINRTGLAKVTQFGKIVTDQNSPLFGSFEATSEIEEQNLALGERLKIYKQLKKEEGEEVGYLEETSRQYETNYEVQAKAREKAAKDEQKYQDDMTKLFIQARQKQAKEEIRAEKEARDYELRERQKEERENVRKIAQQQREELSKQKNRSQMTSMYAGMFDQLEKEEQKAAEYNSKFLSSQNIGIKDLESKAFNQSNPLTGDFKKTADDAVNYWKSKVDEAKSYSQKLTQDQENQIKEAEAAARRTVLEQQKAQWRGDKLAAKDVGQKVSNASWGLDIQVEELKQAGQYTEEVQNKIKALQDSLKGVKDQKGFDEWSKQLQQFNQELELAGEKAKTAFKSESMQLDIENLQTRLNNLKQKYDDFVEANPGKADAGIEESFKRISDAINSIDMNNVDPQKLALLRKEVRNFGADINGIVTPAQSLGQVLSQNLGGIGQYLARFTSAFYVINKSISTIKSMVNEVKSLDTSLMELQKVTTLSGDSLAQFTDNAYKTGKEVGRTGKDVIDAVTTFSRAGYNLQESNELAKAALTMTNVGVDIPNTEAAASDMISILRAYDKQANESMQVIDELYNVANKEPLDFGNITDMLVTAGGTLAQTNTSLEESMGLLTGAFATLRDKSVANGLIMISQRLRGVKEDGEAIEEEGFMPKLKQAFGDVGVEIEDQNGELRSTFDILQDLAGVWDTLSSKQRQYLGEKAAGNRQVKTLNAIMANWDVVEDTIQKANEATGMATEGNEKYLNSIEGRVTQFKSAFQDLARTTIDSDFVKGLVGIGTWIVNTTSNLGGLVPVLTTILGVVTAIKGVKIVEGLKGIGTAISALINGLSGAGGLVGILTSLPGAIGAIIAVVGIITSVVSAVNNARKSIGEIASEKRQGYEDQKAKVEGLNEELKNTQSLMADLSSKGSLTVVEQDEYNRLKETNDQLERQIALEQARLKISQREARETTAREVREYNESTGVKGFSLSRSSGNKINAGLFEALGADWLEKNLALEHRAGAGMYKNNELAQNLDAAYLPSVEELVKAHSAALLKEKQNYLEANKRYYDAIAKNTDKNGVLTENEDVLEYIDVLEDAKNAAQGYVKESETFLNDYLTYLEEKTAGISKVENATPGSLDAYYNNLIDERDRISDVLLTSYNMDLSKDDQSKYILSKYSELGEQIKERVKEAGQITVEELGADGFKELVAEYEKYGWEIEDIAKHLSESLKAGEGEAGILTSIDELISKNFLATESYKNLTAAMTEQQKAGSISIETYKQLVNDKEGLPGIIKYLTLSADGFVLNTEAMYDYIKAQTDEQKLKAIQEYEDKSKAINQLTASIAHYSKFGQDVSSDMAMLEQLEQEKAALAAYIHELDTATGALARYKAAKQTANEDEDYTTGQSAYKDVQEGWKTGKVGTDDYREAMGFLLGDAYGTTLTGEDAYKAANKVGKRYFKDEKAGTNNFIKDLKKAGLATEENGQLQLKEGLTLDSIAEGLAETTGNAKMSEDAVASLFKLLESYSETKFEWPEFITPEEQTEIENRKKQIEELGESEEQVRGKIAEIDKQISEAGEGTDTTKLESQRAGLEQSLQTITEQKAELEEGITPNVDTMSIEDAVARLEKLTEVINDLTANNIEIPVSIQGEYDAILGSIRTRLLGIGRGAEAKITAEDDTAKGVESAKDSVNSIENPDPIELLANNKITPTVALALLSLGLIPLKKFIELLAQNSTGEGIGEAQESLGSAFTDPISAIIEATTNGTDKIVEAAIDAVANKKRTALITVKETPDTKSPTEVTDELNLYKETYSGLREYGRNTIGKYMNTLFGNGNVDLLNRKQIPSSMLGDVGWTDKNGNPLQGGYATLYSSDVRLGENGEVGLIVTPILPDGDPLEADSFSEYISNLSLDENGNVAPESDPLGLVASQFSLDNIPENMRDSYMSTMANLLHMMQEDYYGDGENAIEVPIKPEEESVKTFTDNVESGIEENNNPVSVPEQNNTTPDVTGTKQETVELEFQSNDGGASAIGEVQETADSEPITLTFTSGDVDNLGSHVKEVTGAGIEAGAVEEVYNLRTAYKQLKDAQDNLSETDVNDESAYAEASSQLMSAASNFQTAYSDLTTALGGIPDVDIDADTSAALKKVSDLDTAAGKSVTKTINIQTTGTLPPGLATGTKNAKGGLALVDDGNGAELIEHVNRGTFELGTNNGPRFTQLDKGDVVHTAEETKKIVSRMGKIGGFFKNGLNQAKSIIGGAFAKGVSGSISLSSINRVLNSARKKTTSNKASSGSVASATKAAEKLSDWAKKLFDWAEIRLERLKTITNSFLLNAADAIGYAAKNRELTSAIKSVGDEIRDTTNAYDLYMKQADEIAKKTKLTQATIEKIQKGEIEIGKYNDKQQEKIKLYQEWYNKALNCVDALNDLREQEKELAKQKLDNIIQHYTNRVQQLDNIVRQRESDLELAAAQGRELQASEYNTAIDATTKKLQQLVEEKKALEAELTSLMSEGLIEKESDTWYDYNSKLDDLTNTITETKTAIIELYDTANEVQLTKLGYELDALTNSASRMSDMMSLHTAQGIEEVADSYKDLIDNGMDQIKNLERQNEEYRKQQQGLDVLSEKYQDLESKIQSNIKAIDDMKVSQEGWNDSVLDLKISQLEKYRDQLNKTNDQYERQKELREAIEELQRVQSQRTTRVYRDGVGFTFESNQEDLKEAQQNLEDVVSNQLLSRIDDLIDALEEQKNDTNVYDAQGNLLGSQYSLPQLGTLTEILSSYYSSNNVPAFSGLKNSLYEQIVSGATNNQAVQFSFGDINLSDVNDVNTLADAIVDMLPNAVLQAINRK